MAFVVGFFLFPVVGGWVMTLLTGPDSVWQDIGEWTAAISPVHGVLYMVLLVATALLSREAGWSVGFTITTMLLATVPVVSFYAEHRATRHTRELMTRE